MKHKIKIDKIIRRFFLMLTLAISVCLICPVGVKMTALADEQEQVFNIEAEMLPSRATFDIMLTIENTGEDWEGTVRLMVGGEYGSFSDCVYDTALTLPQGSTKQFVVMIPRESIYSTNEEIHITLFDQDSNVAADKVFEKLLSEEAAALVMGILSDDYRSLIYLDMDGEEIGFYFSNYPIKLMELDKDNLTDRLETLTFLVIDKYDTGVLTEDEISDIEKWVDDGGVLIIGTGSYADDTLWGFDYLGVMCKKVNSPDEEKLPHYSSYYVDWSKLSMAEFSYSADKFINDKYGSLALISVQGDGAVGILPYSLSELGGLDNYDYGYCTQSEFVQKILENVSLRTMKRYRKAYSSYSYDKFENGDALRKILKTLGSNGVLSNFGVLQFIVIVYVIIAGPLLYVILRRIKKGELYQAAVPLAALMGVLLVFFVGRGFEVKSTRVYSVTAYNLSKSGECKTYLHCYDAGHSEWTLRLTKNYEYIGPQLSDNIDESKYYYHIRKNGGRLFFGINPSFGFEGGCFCAGGEADEWEPGGGIGSDISRVDRHVFAGTVTNNTDYDFAYFAIMNYAAIRIYKNLPSGETSRLTNDEVVFSAFKKNYSYDSDWSREVIGRCVEREKQDAISALAVGILSAHQMNTGKTVIIGVVEDWDKAVDDDCSEVSYGCFYIIQ